MRLVVRVAYVNTVKATDNFKHFYLVVLYSLRLDKLNKLSSFSNFS